MTRHRIDQRRDAKSSDDVMTHQPDHHEHELGHNDDLLSMDAMEGSTDPVPEGRLGRSATSVPEELPEEIPEMSSGSGNGDGNQAAGGEDAVEAEYRQGSSGSGDDDGYDYD